MSTEPARIVRLVANVDGSSEFVDAELKMTSRDFAPPAAPFDVSDQMEASGVVFWRAPSGWDGQPTLACSIMGVRVPGCDRD